MKDPCFIPFGSAIAPSLVPAELNDPFSASVPEICKIAAQELQEYLLNNEQHWAHNFGFCQGKTGPVKGKMFGVLVVEDANKALGYLCTFSGKLKDQPPPPLFVPALFDILSDNNFLGKQMVALSEIGHQIKQLESENSSSSLLEAARLIHERKTTSYLLQQKIFDQYQFLNKLGERKSLFAIFDAYGKKPAAGAGECSAPKLLQYAYERKLKPLAIAEFWWGKSTKSEDKIHKRFSPACHDKCFPILSYMLCNDVKNGKNR